MKQIRKTGHYEQLGMSKHFIPSPLPPKDPSLKLDTEMISLYGKAMKQLGQLEEMLQRIPDSSRFLRAYITKEAMLSSEIEGINTTIAEVFSFEHREYQKYRSDTRLVLNYIDAMQLGLTALKEGRLPLSTRVILQCHRQLLAGTDDNADPGNLRRQQVRVGNLLPAPAPHVPGLIAELERFINQDSSTLPLIKAGLAHVQFETIHPFLDGNGRIGRLLIVLMLVKDGLISQPLIYPSYYFKKHRSEYYELLDGVRTQGDWESWISFYLRAVIHTARDAWQRAKNIENLEHTIIHTITTSSLSMKKREEALKLLPCLFSSPVISIGEAARQMGKSYNAAKSLIEDFVELDILSQPGDQKRNKVYEFSQYLHLLDSDYAL